MKMLFPYRDAPQINTALENTLGEPSTAALQYKQRAFSSEAGSRLTKDTSHPFPTTISQEHQRVPFGSVLDEPVPPRHAARTMAQLSGPGGEPLPLQQDQHLPFPAASLIPAREESSSRTATSSLALCKRRRGFASVSSSLPPSTKQSRARNARGHLPDKK